MFLPGRLLFGVPPSALQCSAMIPQDLLDMLVCPVCKKPVALNDSGKSLKCGECRRVYPIQDDIPVMLVDAATIDED
jgi:uncharacterized protein YbaR (Trm112 family)